MAYAPSLKPFGVTGFQLLSYGDGLFVGGPCAGLTIITIAAT
jgi:hypothetical protein